MWEYVKNEHYSDELFNLEASPLHFDRKRGWGGWMEGAMSALYPILHPCHTSPNPQCCAADGGLIGGEREDLLERVQYLALQDVYT